MKRQKRKSTRISALEDSTSNKRKKNTTTTAAATATATTQPAEAEASQGNATPSADVGCPLPNRKRGRKRKRLDEVAFTSFVPQTQQDGENAKHDNPPISSEYLPSVPKMPEKHILEFILDILQRRDTHELFAQPVDPKEVDRYYEIIKEPMDFGTIRAKLQEDMYKTLEQFEGDVFLIPKNAMHFNSSSTIYFRQARAIHDLAKRVFHCLKTEPSKIEHEFFLERRRPGRKPQDGSGSSRTKNTTNLRKNIRAYRGSSSTNHPVNQRENEIPAGPSDVNVCESRQTYRTWTSLPSENETILSTVYNSSKTFVPGKGGIGYRESLMRFVKDLGPTAQKVADRKIFTEVPNYQSQAPTFTIRDPNSLISSSTLRGSTCLGGVMGRQVPCIIRDLPGDSITTTNANDQLGVHGAGCKGKSVLTTNVMDLCGSACTKTMALSSCKMDMYGAVKNALTGHSKDIRDGTYEGKVALPSGRVDIQDASSKGKNVITSDSMDIVGGVCGGKMTPAIGRMDINGATSKGKSVITTDSMDIYGGTSGGKLSPASGRINICDAFQDKELPQMDVMAIHNALQGERFRSSNRKAIGSTLRADMVANPLGIMDSCGPSRGMIPSDRTDVHLQGVADDARHQKQNNRNQSSLKHPVSGIEDFNSPTARIKDASRKYEMDLLLGAIREDVTCQNQNIHNQLGLYLPSAGTTKLNSPSGGIRDACSKYSNMDSSHFSNQVHPAQLALGSQSSLFDFMSQNNKFPRASVHPSKVVKPSRLGQTITFLRGLESHSQSAVEKSDASSNHSNGASSAQVSQLLEWSRPTPWGPQAIHDFSEILPQFNEAHPLGKDALVQEEPQPLVPYVEPQSSGVSPLDQDIFIQQNTQAQNMLPLPCDMSTWGQDAFGQDELQLALASYIQMDNPEPNLFGEDAFAKPELQFKSAPYMPLPTSEAKPLGLDAYVQQETQPALSSYVQPQPKPKDVNPLGKPALVQQEPTLAWVPYVQPTLNNTNLLGHEAFLQREKQLTASPPQGPMFGGGNFNAGAHPQNRPAETSGSRSWNFQQQSFMSTQHPDLALQLGTKHPPPPAY